MGMQARLDNAATDSDTVLAAAWLEQFVEAWRLRHPAAALQIAPPVGDARIANSRAIGRILLTLLDNAACAASNADKPLRLSLIVDRYGVAIQVEDDGRGIDADLQKRLGYEPVKSTTGGQGIGLMLAFATARQIGATIELVSQPHHGTSATVRIPCA